MTFPSISNFFYPYFFIISPVFVRFFVFFA